MYTFAVIVHLIVCFLMVAAILLQAGKGAEIGASFGGTSQTIFGSRGAGTFLSKVTIWTAILFMLTSLGLALLSKQENIASSVIDPSTRAVPVAPVEDTFPGTDSLDGTTPGDTAFPDTGGPDDTTPATPGDAISSDTGSPDGITLSTPGNAVSPDTGGLDDTAPATPESPLDNTSRQAPSN